MFKKLLIPSVLLLSGCAVPESDMNNASGLMASPNNINGEGNGFTNNLYLPGDSEIIQEDLFLSDDELRRKYQEQNIQNDNLDANREIQEINDITNAHQLKKQEALAMSEVEDLQGSMLLEKSEFRTRYTLRIDTDSSFKKRLNTFANQNGYRLVWDSDYDVFFENSVTYTDSDVVELLKSVADDLNSMALDIHMNIYMKNKVVLVYSVRN